MSTRDRLKAALALRRTNISGMADRIGVARSTLYRHMVDECDDITLRELRGIVESTSMTLEEFKDIFLPKISQ